MTTDILAPVRHVIGSRYVESVKPYMKELTGMLQVAGPMDPITKDIRTDRILVGVDEHGDISGLTIS